MCVCEFYMLQYTYKQHHLRKQYQSGKANRANTVASIIVFFSSLRKGEKKSGTYTYAVHEIKVKFGLAKQSHNLFCILYTHRNKNKTPY